MTGRNWAIAAVALFVATLLAAPLVTLVTVKIVTALLFAAAIAAGAGWVAVDQVRRDRPAGAMARAVLLGALALAVLVRGAPHNNPAVFWAFEHHGVAGLLLVTALPLGLGFVLGSHWARRGALPGWIGSLAVPSRLGWAVAALSALAALAALEQVIRHWDVSGWGDAIFWDRLVHLIARGDLPGGHSYYMPVYQYGAAVLYRVFGHAFAVMQVSNVLWAPITVVFLCLAARHMVPSLWGVLLVGTLAASLDYLRYTPHVMQIENWYIPLVAVALWAALRWRHVPTLRAAALLGAAAGLVFSTRSHAAFFDALIVLAPLVLARSEPLKRRIAATMIASVAFIAVLAPWTIRNELVDGRFAVTGTQGPIHMAMSANPQSFFGIRRNLVDAEVNAEWARRYPDPAERERAMSAFVWRSLIGDPMRTVEGAAWRSLAFYGLLPDGVWAPGGPVPTDWRATGKTWLLRNMATLALLIAAGLGLALRRDRAALFLLGGVAASMAPVLVVGFTEARIHYPVLCILILAAASGWRRAPAAVLDPIQAPAPGVLKVALPVMALAALALAGGGVGLYRPVMESALHVGPIGALSEDTPDRNAAFLAARTTSNRHAPATLQPGERIKLAVAVTNHHLPVKWYAETIGDFPDFATDPTLPAYFRAAVVTVDGAYDWGTSPMVALRLAGATADAPLREDDVIEVVGTVRAVTRSGVALIDGEVVHRIGPSHPLPSVLRQGSGEE